MVGFFSFSLPYWVRFWDTGLGTHKTLPEVNVVTSDLKKSMEDYIEDLQRGDEKDVEYSDEEVVPEPYYEPPVDYFSESDPEPEYVPPPRAAPRRPKSVRSSSCCRCCCCRC